MDVLGHPTGRRLLRRDPYATVDGPCPRGRSHYGVALEINCQVDRLDLNDVNARLARERGVRLVISTDAHSVVELGNIRWGVQMARRGWLTPDEVLNTRTLEDLRPLLRRHREAA